MCGIYLSVPLDIQITHHYGKFLPNQFPHGPIRSTKAEQCSKTNIVSIKAYIPASLGWLEKTM